MRAQRPAHAVPALEGVAEHLPFDDRSLDAAMATLKVHQWPDLRAGLREMRRVTRGSVVVLTFDGDALDRFWLADYTPRADGGRAPALPGARRYRRRARRGSHRQRRPRAAGLPRRLHRGVLRRGPKPSSSRRRGAPSRHGGSSTTRFRRGSWSGCAPTSRPACGTSATGRGATRTSSKGHFGSSCRASLRPRLSPPDRRLLIADRSSPIGARGTQSDAEGSSSPTAVRSARVNVPISS